MNLHRTTLCVLIALASPASAKTIKVPSPQHQTVQSAINAANPGDTVEVDGGYFRENVVITKDDITLRGEDGATIDAEYNSACVIAHGDGIRIEDMILRNGFAGVDGRGRKLRVEDCLIVGASDFGILVLADDPTLVDNKILGCSGNHIETQADTSSSVVRIEGNTLEAGEGSQTIEAVGGQLIIRDNESEAHDGGFFLEPSHPTKRSVIEKNKFRTLDSDAMEIDIEAPIAGLIIRDNEIAHCNGDGVRIDATASAGDVDIVDNEIDGPGSSGIRVKFEAAVNAVIEDNEIRYSANDGISARGAGIQILDNEIVSCEDDGIFLRDFSGQVIGNKIKLLGGDGIDVRDEVGPALIAENTIRNAAFDGVFIDASNVTVSDNKIVKNFGDGIDIEGGTGNRIVDNNVSKNNHDGIDNNGQLTRIDDNKCFKNGGGFGPDIAGVGHGQGTVASFNGNDFGTGGQNTPQRLDQ